MKLSCLSGLMIALLLAACATGVAVPADGSFVASETAPDAAANGNPNAAANQKLKPLTSDEEAHAALKVNALSLAKEPAEHDKIVEDLVAMGPRYLKFFKSIDQESVALDMMYVVRRIERENHLDQPPTPEKTKPENPEPEPNQPDPTVKNEGPSIPETHSKLDDYNRAEVERFMATRLEQARRMLDSGQYEQARKVAEAAILLMPDTKLRADFDALILKAKGDSQSELLIAGTLQLDPANLQYATNHKAALFARPLQIHCFLKNVSAKPITLRLFEGEGKESILQLSVTYEQLDYIGNSMSQTGTVRLPINSGDSIALQPNESYQIDFPLKSLTSLDSDAPKKYALGAVRIEAALRVYGARDADGHTLVLRPVSFPRRDVQIFPAKFDLDGALNRPITAIRKALKDGRAQDLFMIAHLVTDKDRRSVGDLLIADDYDDSILAMQHARLKAMNVVFNTGKSWDIKRWRTWWQENRLRQ